MTIPPSRPTAYTGVKSPNPSTIWERTREPSYLDAKLYTVGDYWLDTVQKKFWQLHEKMDVLIGNVLTPRANWVISTFYTRDADPVATDAAPYQVGDFWYNSSTELFWRCTDITYVNNIPTTADWVLDTVSSTGIQTLQGDVGGSVSPVAGQVDILGGLFGIQFEESINPGELLAKVQVDGSSIDFNGSGQLEVVASPPSLLPWNIVAINTTAAVDNGYMANGGGQIVITLPGTFAVGDIIWVKDFGGNGVRVDPAAGDSIFFNNDGIVTHLDSVETAAALQLVGTIANARWDVISSQGNWISP